MRVVEISKHGGPEVLKVQERPDPPLGRGEVRIEVAAAGINFADVMARMGIYPDAPKPPCVVGYEVAGTILELGEGVESFTSGQRVIASTMFGGYASQVVVPASDVISLPDELTFEQGAALPVNYGTAWAGLIGYGNLQPGERVLIHSAGGGVGIAATQIAKHAGAEELGVDHPLDYTKAGWERGLPKFDLIMDAIGGRSLRRGYNQLRAGGRLVAFGVSSAVSGEKRNLIAGLGTLARMPRFNMVKQISESKAVIGLNMLSLWKDHGTLAPWIVPLQALIENGTVKPVVAGAFGFEQAGEAQRMITERRNVGKVVLTP
jgi:NADPH:quinone reductase-like Zn-dependent oxidoreductase